MKQNIGFTFCTHPLPVFFLKEFAHIVETHILQRISQMTVSLKYDIVKKKQNELKHCEIFIKKHLLKVINMGDDTV